VRTDLALTALCLRSSARLHPPAAAPKRNDAERKRTYKTKEETEKTKAVRAPLCRHAARLRAGQAGGWVFLGGGGGWGACRAAPRPSLAAQLAVLLCALQVTATVVVTLLVIAVVVPMLQYYGYTARD
jgi:hypothetical protein